jgi:hypothetical protein
MPYTCSACHQSPHTTGCAIGAVNTDIAINPPPPWHLPADILEIRATAQGWEIRDNLDPSISALFGTDWLPLPLTPAATKDAVALFVSNLPAFSGRGVAFVAPQ